MTDCVVSTPEPRPGVTALTLSRDGVPCTRCDWACGPRGSWAFNVAGRMVCPRCIEADELARLDHAPAPETCLVAGQHTGLCVDDACLGCLPTPAAPGARVCTWHAETTRDRLVGATPHPGRDRTVPSLAELYESLAEAPVGARGAGDGEDAQVVSDQRRQARSAIRAMLVSWCLALAEPEENGGRGLTVPDEKHIAMRTWQAIMREQADWDVAMQAWRASDDDVERARLVRKGTEHRAALKRLRAQRETEADVVAALADHVDRHLAWLLAGEHAGQLVHDVTNAWRWAWALAGGGRRIPTIGCPCGGRVPMAVAEDPGERVTQVFTCPSCGDWGVLGWWEERVGADPGPMRLSELPGWLAHWHGLSVSVDQLRRWARGDVIRGAHRPDRVVDGETVPGCGDADCAGCARTPPRITPVAADGGHIEDGPRQGKTYRYDPHAVALVARRLAAEGRLRSA